jgi:hypothetical protein
LYPDFTEFNPRVLVPRNFRDAGGAVWISVSVAAKPEID